MVKIKHAVAGVAAGALAALGLLSMSSTAYAASLTTAQIQSIISLLTSFGVDSATIANVNSTLTGSPVIATTPALKLGSTGPAVAALQKELVAAGFLKMPAGVAYGYYGKLTAAAVVAKTAASAPPVVPASVGISVVLAPTSPNGTVLVAGQAIGKLADFTFTNPTVAPVQVKTLAFTRAGASNDSTISNVYLYSGASRITDSAGVSNSSFMFSDPSALFTIPAGSAVTISVRADIATNTSGQQVGVNLVTVNSTGTLNSSSVFPISSGLQTVSAATLAGVDFSTIGVTTATISPQPSFPLWTDTVNVSRTPVSLKSVKFTNRGSADSNAVQNYRLFVDGSQVGATVQAGSDRSVSFDLTANPANLSTQNHTIKVLADVVGGASRTIQLSLQRSSDAMFVDSQLGQPVTSTVRDGNFTSMNGPTITVNSIASGVSVSRDPASPSNDVALGASNVKLASFDVLVSGENVKLETLDVTATVTGGASLANGKVFVNGSQYGSSKTLSATVASFGVYAVLPAGQVSHIDVYADAKTPTGNLSNGDTIKVTLATGSGNAQGQSSLNSANVPASSVDGNVLTVTNSSLSASKFSGYGDQNVVAGSNGAKIGEFTLSTGSTEGVTVNTIVISQTAPSELTNLSLKDESTGATLGNVLTTPSASNSFNVNVDLAVSSSKTIGIYANILSSAIGPFTSTVTTGTSGVGATTGNTTASNSSTLQTITVGAGSISASVGAGNPSSANILAGTTNTVGQFTFNAVSSSYTVQNLGIAVNGSAAVSNVNLTYKNASGATLSATQVVNSGVAKFTGLSLYVPANDQSDFSVSVVVPTVANIGASLSGATTTVALSSSDFRAINTAGSATTTISAQSSGSTFVVRKSIPTFSMLPVSTNIPSSGTPLYRFSVTADPLGSIDLKQVTFNLSTTSTSVTQLFLINESSGQSLSVASDSPTIVLTTAQQIAAGSSKTFALYGTVGGFGTGASLSLNLVADLTAGATGNTSWSDRSTVGTFTNGYLLKNFTTNATSFSR